MAREGFSELIALIAVAQTGSFTRAAAQQGVHNPLSAQAYADLRNGWEYVLYNAAHEALR